MSVSSTVNKTQPLGDGSTVSFEYPFKIFANTDLVVKSTVIATGVTTDQTLTTDYTVTGAGVSAGGTVVFGTAPAAGTRITIERVLPLKQLVDLRNNGAYFAETHEAVFDRLVMITQQQQAAIARSLVAPSTDTAALGELPNATDRASKLLSFDADGNPVAVAASSQDATAVAQDLATLVPTMAASIGYIPRVNAGGTGFEYRTAAQTLSDIAALPLAGGTMTGDLLMGAGTKIIHEGTTADAHELTIDPGEPTADRTQTHPDKSGTFAMTSDIVSEAYIQIRDEQASGTQGGSSSATTWHTRVLNTESADTGSNAALAANQITLAAGTYRVRGRAPASASSVHKIRLRNVTAGTTLAVGSSAYQSPGSLVQTDSVLQGRFTVAAGQALELQHYISSARATDGLGTATTSGEVEVYAEIEFWKEL